MKNFERFDQILKQALSAKVEPNEELNQKIIEQFKENNTMKPVYKKKMSIVMIAAILTLAMSITAFAACYFLSPKQVAEQFEDQTLANAFDSKKAVEISKTVASGEYNFTLLGIVSGEGLSKFKSSAEDINPDRTYAVVSITKQDGSKMPATQDEEYGETPFFVSPLIKGQKPWQVNIASMNGNYSECVIDGIMYRMIECDGVEMFADRGLYLCVSTSSFYDIHAFNYNEETGEISTNSKYDGANALFDLPIDAKKADHEKAEKYLKELLEKPTDDSADSEEVDIDFEKELANGVVIPESVKEVTYDKNGMVCYEYDGVEVKASVESLFEAGQTGISNVANISEGNDGRTAVQFSRDANGVITGWVFKLK